MSLVGTYTGHTYSVRYTLRLSDGRVASGDSQKYIHIWSIERLNASLIFRANVSGLYSLAQVSSDLIAVGGSNTTIFIYYLANGTLYRRIDKSNSSLVYYMAVYGSTNVLVVGGCSGYLETYDYTTGALLDSKLVNESGCILKPGRFINSQLLVSCFNTSSLYLFNITSTGSLSFTNYSTGLATRVMSADILTSYPYNGACSASPSTGTALTTSFTISCSNWTVDNGNISSYLFYGN